MTKISLGKKGEEIAQKFLEDHGFKIIDKNFRSRVGEIDLIAEDKDTLVFVEVKTRFSSEFGAPEEAVTPYKVKNISKVGDYYRNIRTNLPELSRIDVVAIEFEPDGKLNRVELIKNVTG